MAYNRTTKTITGKLMSAAPATGATRRLMLAKATSAMALATGLAIGGCGTAHAQAYEGDPTVVSGGVVINRTTGNDDIQVDTDQAVINWTTNDMGIGGGVINFLPNGRTVVYRNNPSFQNQFTVLNRIIPNDPGRAIALNGTIISQLQTGAGLVSGGNVWFYSPGGVVVGSTGVIDVGGLLLSSLDPVVDGNGAFINGAGSFTLGPAGSSTSYIQIDPGALIQATPENSYVAMVAPIIRQNGVVDVNGSALMVGAEAATISFGFGGLFNIEVTTGTDGDAGAGNTAISHNGVTTGPASGGSIDNHRIYMVAVPKNNAITMAIGAGSQLGFDIAGAVDVIGNSIILSAGYNVFGDFIDTSSQVNPAQAADIVVSPADITSSFVAAASRDFIGQSFGGDLNFFSDVQAFGANSALFNADGSTASINVGGNLRLSANAEQALEGADAVAGAVRLRAANGGVISLSSNAELTAVAFGGSNDSSGTAGSGTGGIIEIAALDGGLIAIAGGLRADASGFAGSTETNGIGSNFGRGGTIGVFTLGSGGTLLIDGTTELVTSGFGGPDGGSATGTGGAGFGGRIDVFAQGSGHLMRFGDAFLADATGFGGSGANAGNGGSGAGGQIFVSTEGASTLDFLSDLSLLAFGFGGTSGELAGASGGAATGGTASLSMGGSGGLISVAGDASISAGANGGTGENPGTLGGNATGGSAIIFQNAAGGNLTIGGTTQVDAFGFGGLGTFAGNGIGGSAQIAAQNTGQIDLLSGAQIRADGFGGSATTSGSGSSGSGFGGDARMVATLGGAITVVGDIGVSASGSVFSTALTGIDGGNGTGGTASISQATAGVIAITGNADVIATGQGDVNQGGGDGVAGTGTGGDARIAVNDLTITIGGTATVDASGFGGGNLGGIRGGNGIGGLANLGAGVGTLSIGGDGIARASGIGGDSLTAGSGGDGTGGTAIVGTISPTAIIGISGLLDITANGEGGSGDGGIYSGGNGTGGTAQVFAQTGTVNITGTSFLSASAFGGDGINDAAGGSALGGIANIITLGVDGQINLGDSAFLSAFAGAGSSFGGIGNTGTATAGSAFVEARDVGSAITIAGSLFADATAFGGSTNGGIIGLATGGVAVSSAQSGTLQIDGDTSLDASATGGSSLVTGNGGAATAGRTGMVVFGTGGGSVTTAGTLTQLANGFGGIANTGTGGVGTGGLNELGTLGGIAGTLTVGGAALMQADGQGGNVLGTGVGGNGIGGISRAGVTGATLTGTSITISAKGLGGNGGAGSAGGNGTGGNVGLVAGSGPATGVISFADVTLSAEGAGGDGGDGLSGTTGGAGGAGGNGTGGFTQLFGSAGNGQLQVGNALLTSNGVGGFGGAGGIGLSGAGGIGGVGGTGTGGFNQIGTFSGTASPLNIGFAEIGDAFVQAFGFGGIGGAGGTGSLGNGNGGNGGAGLGGQSTLLVRGSRVTIGDVSLFASGIGGDGGLGAIAGNGGDGTGGGVAVLVTERFETPSNRGILEAGDILGIAQGIAGSGAVAGQSFYETGSQVVVRLSDANVQSLVINTSGNAPAPNPREDFIAINDGTLNVAGTFTFATPNALSVLVENGSLAADTIGLSAGTFVPDTVTTPVNPGTITANAIDILSGNDIIVSANLQLFGDFSASAGGLVNLGDIDAGGIISISGGGLNLGNLNAGNHISLLGGGVSTGAISAGNFVEIFASGGIFTSDIVAGGYILALTDTGDISLGNLDSGEFIALETGGGNIAVGNVTSLEETEFDAIGSVSFGDVTTGLNFEVLADGDISGGNIVAQSALSEANYGVGLAATGNIQVGSIQSTRTIGALSTGTFTSGGLSTGESVILLVDGDIAINGGITTGTAANRFFYIGNSSMSALLDDGGGNDNTSFIGGDPSPVFAAAPVRTLGSLTVTGPIQTGNFVVGLGTGFAVNGPITATNGRIAITANSISVQDLTSTLNTTLNATSGNIAVGSVTAGGAVGLLAAAGQITAGTLTGTSVGVDGLGAVSIGGVTTTGAAQLRSIEGAFTSIGAITGGTVNIGGASLALANVTSTAGAIAMAANAGNLSFGTLTSSANTQFSATGSVTGGDITAGSWIGAIAGSNLTLGNLRTTGPGGAPTTGFSVGLGANGAIATGTIDSFGSVGIGSDDGQGNVGNATSIATGAINAGGSAFLRSTEALTTGAITSANEIRVRGGTVTTGALNAANAILAAAMTGSLATGNVTSGTSAVLLASQSVTTGAIATGASGTAYIGNSSAIPAAGLISTIDLPALLATTPSAVGGSITIGGPVTTGTLTAASNDGFSANAAITAGTRISIETGGTATFGGLATAPTMLVSSGDIALSQNGALGDANTGTLTLTNSGDGRMLIGGSASGEGYILDASEMSRLRAGAIIVRSPFSGSSGIGIEIRDFTLNGSGASSGANLNGAEGSLAFETSSTIRVNGNAIFNSMASANRVALGAGRVEINADTGGIFLNGSSPGGVLSIRANAIHIASASLLEQLAQNPTFTGRDAALAQPITPSRPDGVIQASRLVFNVGDTLLIQNTGTALLNAGFFGRVGSVEINPIESQSSQPRSIDMVIYGQLLDSGDVVRNGSSVRDLLFPPSSGQGGASAITGFTANSSVNGCALNAASCGSSSGGGDSDGGAISQEGPTIVSHAGPTPPQPSEERQAEREQEEAEAAAEAAARGEAAPRRPIMPPVTIVNTRNLGVEPIIAEPVTSGGNPNLQLDQPLPTPMPETGGQP